MFHALEVDQRLFQIRADGYATMVAQQHVVMLPDQVPNAIRQRHRLWAGIRGGGYRPQRNHHLRQVIGRKGQAHQRQGCGIGWVRVQHGIDIRPLPVHLHVHGHF